jgi:hypothetical protein
MIPASRIDNGRPRSGKSSSWTKLPKGKLSFIIVPASEPGCADVRVPLPPAACAKELRPDPAARLLLPNRLMKNGVEAAEPAPTSSGHGHRAKKTIELWRGKPAAWSLRPSSGPACWFLPVHSQEWLSQSGRGTPASASLPH